MNRETKTFHFNVKAVDDEQGFIEAYGSVFNIEDEGGDVVKPGAFRRTITNSKARVQAGKAKYLAVMLWQHQQDIPIGGWTDLTEDAHGLLCKGQIILTTQQGKEAYELIKGGVINEFSIGYDIPSDGANYDSKDHIRNLTELRLWEVSPVTFAMNQEALLTSVKALELKTICGNTSGPIGPRDEAWDGSKAEGQIWDAAYNEDTGKINTGLAKKYFMVVDGDSQKKGSYSYPFWYVDGSPHICVGACKAIAAAIQGARGASAPTGLKAKVETLYKRINSKYPDDTPLTPPWSDDGKRSHMNRQQKTLLEHYNEEMAQDLLEDWQDVYVCSLTEAILDAFTIGDSPESDISQALDDFKELVLSKFVAQATECDLSGYLEEHSYSSSPADYIMQYGNDSRPNYGGGYMSRRTPMTRKAMYAGDATTGGFVSGKADGANMGPVIVTQEHVDRLNNAAQKAIKAITTHAESLHNAADEVTTLIGGGTAVTPNEKRALPFAKAGRTFSAANVQALSQHADDLHDLADSHTKTMKRQVKAITNVADDLATILQGSEAAYGSDRGTPDDGNQEGKRSQRTPYIRTRTAHARPSQDDTVSEDEIEAALAKLTAL